MQLRHIPLLAVYVFVLQRYTEYKTQLAFIPVAGLFSYLFLQDICPKLICIR